MTAVIEVAALQAFIAANAKDGVLTPIVVVPPVPPPTPGYTVGDTPGLIFALKLAKSGDTIALLPAGAVLRTPNGKLRRAATLERFERQEMTPLFVSTVQNSDTSRETSDDAMA